ncbi:unnamed protein product, partial [Mesorhabditis spiculigera]
MVVEVKRTGCSSVFVVSALSHSALRPLRGYRLCLCRPNRTPILGSAILNIPDEFTEANLDTVSWSINKTFVQPIGYMFPVVAGIFASQALPNDENTDGNVLFLLWGRGIL